MKKFLFYAACLFFLMSTGAPLGEAEETKDTKGSLPYTLDEVSVTATKVGVSPDTVPFTYHSVDRKDIEAQPNHYMNNFGELVRDMPGVHVAQYYPWGPPWVHLCASETWEGPGGPAGRSSTKSPPGFQLPWNWLYSPSFS